VSLAVILANIPLTERPAGNDHRQLPPAPPFFLGLPRPAVAAPSARPRAPSQRAALHAITPHLQDLQNQNADLRSQVVGERRRALDERVAAFVPDYQTIDADPAWHRWLIGAICHETGERRQKTNAYALVPSSQWWAPWRDRLRRWRTIFSANRLLGRPKRRMC
jgi:hypothetical protein